MYKLLLVEDNNETAEYVKSAFELEEMDVDIANDGQEGWDLFQRNEYDLILLDLEMPKMNGEELLIKIRNVNPYIDIIVYTNYAEFGDIKRLVNLGINGYINKGPNSDLEELVSAVKNKIEPMDENRMEILAKNTEAMRE